MDITEAENIMREAMMEHHSDEDFMDYFNVIKPVIRDMLWERKIPFYDVAALCDRLRWENKNNDSIYGALTYYSIIAKKLGDLI